MKSIPCLIAIGLAALGMGCSQAAVPAGRCATLMPAEMRGVQPRWLGQCVKGKANGVGVLRVGARAPYGFFFGRVIAGRPQTGLIILSSGNMMQIRGLTASGAVLSADGEHLQEQDRAWADAAAGARLVARRFATMGNVGSSAYYADWAHKIETQRPE